VGIAEGGESCISRRHSVSTACDVLCSLLILEGGMFHLDSNASYSHDVSSTVVSSRYQPVVLLGELWGCCDLTHHTNEAMCPSSHLSSTNVAHSSPL
jgi:hypothetical protein